MLIIRQTRKLEHVKYSLQLPDGPARAGFDDLIPVPRAAPELSLGEIDPSCSFMNKRLAAPLLINAMTGGHPEMLDINRSLARVARQAALAMAVGSQRAALDDPGVRETFAVVREENPGGLVLANLNAGCTLAEAREAVAMVKADGLQLHLNVAQELAMEEGEADFRGVLARVGQVVRELEVPVVVKEVGFGLDRETVAALVELGVRCLDVGGSGGTNFAAIEGRRRGRIGSYLEEWGMPTAVSLLEALSVAGGAKLIASGGVRNAFDAARALMAGAVLVGIARPLLQIIVHESEAAALGYIRELIDDLRSLMLLVGAWNLETLRRRPLVITGFTARWLETRGIDYHHYARRR
ncbi:MAG: type 2 isopentenyl-diphosphate Delta-isomerase [Bacillota bacterium]|jgi:isopentenyl-diphosphate delta-isomerase